MLRIAWPLLASLALAPSSAFLGGCAATERPAKVAIGPKQVAPAGAGETTYVWAEGDDLTMLAKRFDCPTEWLIERNGIVSKQDLQPGRTLVVPRK